MSRKTLQYFRTSNLALASFLLCKGAKLDDIEHTRGSTRALFVFSETPNTEDLTKHYEFALPQHPDMMVDFRDAYAALKTLKERLYMRD